MPWRDASARRRACIAGLVTIAVLGSIFVLSYADSARTQSGSKSFQSGISIRKTKLYCSGQDNRIYLKSVATYGQPIEQHNLAERVALVQVKVQVLKRKGKRRVIASAIEKGSVEFKPTDRKISRLHTVRFGPKHSKRILRYAYGKSSCKDRKLKGVIVRLHASESFKSSSSNSATSMKRHLQRKRQSQLRKVRYRSCVPYRASDCSSAPRAGVRAWTDRV